MKDPDTKSIETLFEDEHLANPYEDNEKTRVLKAITLTPSPEALAAAKNKDKESEAINWEERREFSRAETQGKEIVLAFTNDQQFAKQYVENISLGGLFVRTAMRPGLGAIVPIDFSVPTKENKIRRFVLKARVCRESEEGLGLQFIDLSTEMRKSLEEVVKASLPEGTALANQVKKGSRERLEKFRDERESTLKKRWKTAKTTLVIGSLLVMNFFMGLEVLEIQDFDSTSKVHPTFRAGEKEISVERIRSIAKRADGRIEVSLTGDQKLDFDLSEIDESLLPPHLRETLRVVRTLQPPKALRRTKNPMRVSR